MNLLSNDDIHVGDAKRQALKTLPTDAAQKHCIMGMCNFMKNAAEYLIEEYTQSTQDPVKQLCCLNPNHCAALCTVKSIQRVAKQLPVNENYDSLTDEWLLYQTEETLEEWHTINSGELS